MLINLAPQSAQFVIKAIYSLAGQTSHISLASLSDKRSDTGGLHGTLKLYSCWYSCYANSQC